MGEYLAGRVKNSRTGPDEVKLDEILSDRIKAGLKGVHVQDKMTNPRPDIEEA